MARRSEGDAQEAYAGEDMWVILAIIQPFKLDAVTLALEELPGFGGMTVSECRGFGRGKLAAEGADELTQSGKPASRAAAPGAQVVDFTAKVRIEIAVAGREVAERVIETISRAAHTGRRGDGKIFAWPIERAIRIRTFDERSSALQ